MGWKYESYDGKYTENGSLDIKVDLNSVIGVSVSR